MKFKIQRIIQLVFLLTCKEKISEQNIEKNKSDYLSDSWLKKKLIVADSDSLKQKELIKNSEEFLQKGISFYKLKQDQDAIKNYESAIESYPTGEIYYHYGNSLANLNRLEDSIFAYKISLLLKPKRPELVSYNIACSFSRLRKIDDAYTFLSNSIDLGYNAF